MKIINFNYFSCNEETNSMERRNLHQVPLSPSSEEDNSPTEMNNCRRLLDKPPLVKFTKSLITLI